MIAFALIATGLGLMGLGWWVDRRFGAAARYEGIGNPAPGAGLVLALGTLALIVGTLLAVIGVASLFV